MYEAARVDDPIYHTSALAGFLIGAIIGIAIIALAAFAFFSCGFLAGLILGFMADQIASGVLQLGEAIGRSIHHTAGKILTGSENVSTNSRPAARAVLSTVKCDNHIAEKRIAQGSENIYINSQPAARKDDHTECDAVIEDGSPNVFLGGGTQTVLEISSEIRTGCARWWMYCLSWRVCSAGWPGRGGRRQSWGRNLALNVPLSLSAGSLSGWPWVRLSAGCSAIRWM